MSDGAMTDLVATVLEHGLEALIDRIERTAAMLERRSPFVDQIRRELLGYAEALRHAHTYGSMTLAVMTALRLGALEQELAMMCDRPSRAGVRNIAGGHKGAERRRQQTNYDQLRQIYNEVRPECCSNAAAYRKIEKRCGVHVRTVRRAVTGH